MEFARRLRTHVVEFEKLCLKPEYNKDGTIIIGFGRKLTEKGISSDEASFLLANDIQAAHVDLVELFGHSFYSFPDNIRLVLMDLRLCLGPMAFRKMGNLVDAAKQRKWGQIIRVIVESQFYKRNCIRATALVRLIDVLILPLGNGGGAKG